MILASSTMQLNASQLYSLSKKALFQNEIKKAVDGCRILNTEFPEFFEGWCLAGCIHLRLKKPEAGLISTARALSLRPNEPNILIQRVECFSLLGRQKDVRKNLQILAAQKCDSAALHEKIAMMLSAEQMHSEAIKHFLSAIAYEPNSSILHYNLAAAYRFIGELDKCEDSLNTCLALNNLDSEAQGMRSSLRRQSIDSNHLDELLEAYSDPNINDQAKAGICYALAKEYDDLNDPENSFNYLKTGSDIRRGAMSYDVSSDEKIIEQIIRTFDKSYFLRDAISHESSEPIFIIGLPRTGTTLLERILDGHTNITSAGELDIFGLEVMALSSKKDYSKKISALDLVQLSRELDVNKLALSYLKKARPLNLETSHFIDKLPLNFLYAGLIHSAIPNAKIIHLSRHPIAACLAIYKQQFRDIYPFSYNLSDLGKYYVAYDRLMRHWQSVMPGVIHSIAYESLVLNTEQEVKRVLDFCNLKWEAECLKFYENKAPSTTASAIQVRQAVYKTSVDQWRKYTPYLRELSTILIKAGVDVS